MTSSRPPKAWPAGRTGKCGLTGRPIKVGDLVCEYQGRECLYGAVLMAQRRERKGADVIPIFGRRGEHAPDTIRDLDPEPLTIPEGEEADSPEAETLGEVWEDQEEEDPSFIEATERKLQPHQARVRDKLLEEDREGLIVMHGLGSGKTLTSIEAQDALDMEAVVVAPAALLDNYEKERAKHGARSPVTLISMQRLAREGDLPPCPLLIVDEAHRLRDCGSKAYAALRKHRAEKVILLTASAFYNHPVDIATLIALIARKPVLPVVKSVFESQYVCEAQERVGFLDRMLGKVGATYRTFRPDKETELREVFDRYVDYFPGGGTEDYPEVTREDVLVEMTRPQAKLYDALAGHMPDAMAQKILKGLPPSKKESKQLNAFLGAIRQVANTTYPFGEPWTSDPDEPKILQAVADLIEQVEQGNRVVLYSNYLRAGIARVREMLVDASVTFGEFTGEMPKGERDELVRRYNAGDVPVLLLSSAGGEGLDLKCTRLLQILEPHWNSEKIRQVEGRGARFRSHVDLAVDSRHLLIRRYLSTRPKLSWRERLGFDTPGFSVDQYLVQMSDDKEDLIEEFKQLFS